MSGRTTTLLAVAAAVVVAGVCTFVYREYIQDGPRVVVVGDSVTELAKAHIPDQLEGDEELELVAYAGYTTAQLLPHAENRMKDPPAVAVVLTGHNDLLRGEDTSRAVEEVVELVDRAECGILVLLPTKLVYGPEAATAFNDRLEELAADTDIHIETGWRDAVDDTPDESPDLELIDEADALHPTERGAEVLAGVMGAAIDRWCR